MLDTKRTYAHDGLTLNFVTYFHVPEGLRLSLIWLWINDVLEECEHDHNLKGTEQ